MRSFVRRIVGIVVVLFVASAANAVDHPRLDELVLRNGFLSVDYNGSETGLRLVPVGRWNDARGNARYTIWRIRNPYTSAKPLRLESVAFSLSFAARARSETYVRSPIASNEAHRLYNGTSLVATQSPGATTWSDATVVAPLSSVNRAPVFLDSAPTLAEIAPAYRHAPIVDDPDRELVTLTAAIAPAGFVHDEATHAFMFAAESSQVGTHAVTLRAQDASGARADQAFSLRLLADFCPIYPIALADAPLANATPGQQFLNTPRGTGPGNFGLLTWAGSPNAPTLAASLARPGNSYTYIDPDDAADHEPGIGDWLQGSPGNSNSSAVRSAMDALLGQDIVLPTWSATRGQGSNFDYRAARFARVRVSAYSFTGNGTLSFAFHGWARCYNDAPVATDSQLEVTRNSPKAFQLLASDAEGDALTYTIVTPPAHGALSGTAPNLTYTPAAGYVGNDRIAFTASDGELSSTIGFVDIVVSTPANTAPDAVAQTVPAMEDLPVPIVLTGTDAEGNSLSFTVLTQPAHGDLSGNAPHLVYTPIANYHGDDEFTFEVSDGPLHSTPASVSITIAPVNDAPAAIADSAETTRGVAIAVELQGSDVDGDTLTFAVTTPPQHGALSGDASNLLYTPSPGYTGTDRFAFVARDGELESAPAFFDLLVLPPRNTAPQAQSQAITTPEDAPKAIVLAGFDAEGDPLTFTIETQPTHGTLSGSAPNLLYTPATNYHGNDALTYSVSDGTLQSPTATIAITVVALNDAPVGTDQTVQTRRDTAASITLAGFDEDADALTYAVTMPPAHGTLSGTAPNLTYTPTSGYVGSDRIAFTANDGTVASAVAYIDIAVTAPPIGTNHAPVATPLTLTVEEDTQVTLPFAGTDQDGDALTISLDESQPLHGSIAVFNDVEFVYMPEGDYFGTDTFTYRVDDGLALSEPATVRVTITPVDDAAGAGSETVETDEEQPVVVTLPIRNPDGGPLDIQNYSPAPEHGSLSGHGAMRTYTPDADFAGEDSFGFYVSDEHGNESTGTVTVIVHNLNDAPHFTSTPVTAATEAVDYRYMAVAIDVDGDPLHYTLVSGPAGAVIDATAGLLLWTPTFAQIGSHDFVIEVDDGHGESDRQSFTVSVGAGANAPPVFDSVPPVAALTGEAITYTVLAHDPDADAFTLALTQGPAGAVFDAQARVLTWTPDAEGAVPFAIEALDARGARATQAFTIAVSAPEPELPPVITSTPSGRVQQGATYGYDVDAADPNTDDTVRFSLDTSPNGMTINPVAGSIAWVAGDSLVGGVETQNRMCRRPTDLAVANMTPRVKWVSHAGNALSAPVVGPLHDTNGDGLHDGRDERRIVTVFDNGVDCNVGFPAALDGRTGQLLHSFNATLGSGSHVALGDLDGDGPPEVVGLRHQSGTVAFNNDGSVKWTSPYPLYNGCYQQGAPTIADLDGDGSAEVIVNAYVLNADGSLRFQGHDPLWHAIVGLAVDFDLDGRQEVVLADRVLDANGQRLFTLQGVAPGAARGHAVLNADSDLYPEIVSSVYVNSQIGLGLFDHDGRRIWFRPYASYNQTPVTVGDVDGDGRPEIVVLHGERLRTLRLDGTELWSFEVDENSHMTGAAMADLDGNGYPEIAFLDEHYFRLFDGRTGAVLFQLQNRSSTATESPVIADIDNDGHAEILVPRNFQGGLLALEGLDSEWIATRGVWNQYAYSIDNVDDDLGIPRVPRASWLSHNTFRLNAFPVGHPLGQPDLALFELRLAESNGAHQLVVRARNRGLSPGVASSVRFYAGEPGPGAALLGEVPVPAIAAGGSRDVTLAGVDLSQVGNRIHATIDESGANEECIELNNDTRAAPVTVRASDTAGLFDQQTWAISVAHRNDAPTIQAASLARAIVGVPFTTTISATDPDIGDALDFKLVSPLAGAEIDPQTGVLRWTPLPEQAGTRTLRVRVTDLENLTHERDFIVTVSAGNQAPVFVSTPVTSAASGAAYTYDADATDADGDAVSFALVQSPGDMTVAAGTGILSWAPGEAQVGEHEIALLASDGYGGSTLQQFVLTVSGAGNQPPVITSVPSTNAMSGESYGYLLMVTDPDGDPMTFELATSPSGMTIDGPSRAIAWTPTVAQVGDHAVSIIVRDGRGGVTAQSYTITVRPANANHAPYFTSTPSHSAKATREYTYAIAATDPDGDALSYTLTTAPAGMTMDPSTHVVRWTPVAAGVAEATVRIADGQAYVEQTWPITVLAADVPLVADVIASPRSVAPGDPVTITLAHPGAAGPVTRSVRVDGVDVALDAAGQATVTSSVIGRHVVDATVNDGYDTATDSDEFFVSDPSDTDAPVVQLLSPDDNAEITAPSPVRGTVTDSNLLSWILAVRPSNSPEATPTILAQGGNTFTDAAIAQFDPTLMLNGQYALILQATDTSGRVSFDSAVLRVTGDMKVGHFSITFEDVSIPVAGIPVRVTRTYDTRQRDEVLDFGHGWSVDYQNVRMRESQKPGFSWQIRRIETGNFDRYCAQSNGNRVVTITLPDGQVETFRAVALSPGGNECENLASFANVTLAFVAIDGTDSKLEQLDYGTLLIPQDGQSGHLHEVDRPSVPVDPRKYRLTTPEGVKYELDQFVGITKVTEPNGNTLTYSHDGIQHSAGIGVTFVRDAQDRIREIVLPDGEVLSYTYDAAGDLATFADQLDQTTRLAYLKPQFPHYLTDITDPRGVKVARNEYDEHGRLVATIDADEHRIVYEHNIEGRMERVRDRNGHWQTFIYDDQGRVLSETNEFSETTLHTYDDDGNELTRTDDLGHTTTWTYDARGNRLTETNDLGETTTSTYDARNSLITQTDALDNVVLSNTYHPLTGALVAMEDALGHTTSFDYDSLIGSGQTGELTSMTDALNHVTRYELDNQNRGWRVAEVDAMGHRTTYTHDSMGRVLTETRTRTVPAAPTVANKAAVVGAGPAAISSPPKATEGTVGAAPAFAGAGRAANSTFAAPKAIETLTTTYTYDDKGRVTRVDQPDGTFSTTEYNAIDKPLRECDALSRCTEHVYDARGNETETRYPDGTRETRTYDANGNVLTQTDRGGRTTRMVYDAAGRATETIHPDSTPGDSDNPRSRSEYDGAGRLVASIDEKGNRTEYEYDAANRRTKVIQPATATAPVATTITVHDDAGRRTSVTDAEGHTTSFVYDDAGRATETVFHDGERAKVEYDALGRKVADIDPDNRRTTYAYDDLGRLLSVRLAAGTPSETLTRYEYDEHGNRITQVDAEGRSTRFTHDKAGRELSRTLPMGQRETKAYDALGRPESQTDFLGKITRWSYDSVDRVSRIDYPNDADVSFTYTATGQRGTATDGLGIQDHAYDARERLVRKTDAYGRTIEYTYDTSGNLISRVSANQSLVYSYDTRNRMTSVTATVTGQPPRTTRYEYDQAGNRKAMLGADGVRTEYTYDTRNRLTNLVKRTAASALLFAASYTVDATGMRTAIAETDGSGPLRTVAYQYDALKRLTQEAITHREGAQHRTSAWTYDKVGNRKSQSVTMGAAGATPVATFYNYDANDRLLTETTDSAVTTYTYDANGNTLSRAKPGLLTEYAYDDSNRLKEMREGGDRTTYAYDVDGLRLAQTTFAATGGSLTTEYLRDGAYAYSQVVEQFTRTNGGAAQVEAVLTFADDLVAQSRYVGSTATTHTVHSDGLGSTRFLMDTASASITDTWSYDAFGSDIERVGATPSEHLFRGEQFDPNLGFYYLRARYMDPMTGRFASMDPFVGFSESPLSLHKYLYVNADPVNFVDPTGWYTADFGRAVEDEVCAQYRAQAVTGPATECGDVSYYSYERYFKPDIMDWGVFQFNEVKPLSPSGVIKGRAQIAAYKKVYGTLGFSPNTVWTPRPAVVDGDEVVFFNLDGVIFYTDDDRLQREMAAATLATVAMIVKMHATKVATRLGADAVLRAAVTRGIATVATANAGRLVAQSQLVILTRF